MVAPVLALRPQARRAGRLRKRRRKLRATKPAAIDARRFQHELLVFFRQVRAPLERALREILTRTERQFLRDSAQVVDTFADDLQRAFEQQRLALIPLANQARQIAGGFVRRQDRRHRSRFYREVEASIGIDVAGLVVESGLDNILTAKAFENAQLITSIPAQYLDRVETMVFEATIQGRTSAKSLIEELLELGDITESRARFIARDQTAKMNAALNRARNEALGIESYVWETSKDERVRDNHASKEGVEFRWDEPPKDTGHPGEDYQCRCTARPVLDL